MRRFSIKSLVMACAGVMLLVVPASGGRIATPSVGKSLIKSAQKGCAKVSYLDIKNPQKDALQGSSKKGRKLAFDKELYRPMTEKDMRRMLKDLEPVKLKKTEGWAVRALAERKEVDLDRMRVLLSDSIILLTDMKNRKALNTLKEMKGMGKADMAWMERAFQIIHGCAMERYREFGGQPVYDESLRVVTKYRRKLESLLSKGIKTGALSFDGRNR